MLAALCSSWVQALVLKSAEPDPSFAWSSFLGSFKGAAESSSYGQESRKTAMEGPASSGGSFHPSRLGMWAGDGYELL